MNPRKTARLLAGVLLLLVALNPRVDMLGMRLLSAHVLQHFLLALIIPPLLLLGTPRSFAERALRHGWLAQLERALGNPGVAWPIGVLAMIAWHVPVLFNAAIASMPLHMFQHLSFLLTGAIFWWPICGPLSERRPGPLGAIVYLFSACTACSILGAAITFTPLGAYAAYAITVDAPWGLDSKSDQQLGGMLMWVPGCLVYLTAILACVARWYAADRLEASQ